MSQEKAGASSDACSLVWSFQIHYDRTNNIARRPRNISLEQKPAYTSFLEPSLMPEIYESAGPLPWLAYQQRRTRRWLHTRLGIDHAIGFTILARIWSSAAGLVTVGLIARFLSPAEQGYYYTFGSLIALQIVFELGFSFVILQLATHERAHLTISENGTISGDTVAHARLASVLQRTIRWYSVAALLLAAFLLTGGSHFFSMHHHSGDSVSWHLPWYAAALAATLTFQIGRAHV